MKEKTKDIQDIGEAYKQLKKFNILDILNRRTSMKALFSNLFEFMELEKKLQENLEKYHIYPLGHVFITLLTYPYRNDKRSGKPVEELLSDKEFQHKGKKLWEWARSTDFYKFYGKNFDNPYSFFEEVCGKNERYVKKAIRVAKTFPPEIGNNYPGFVLDELSGIYRKLEKRIRRHTREKNSDRLQKLHGIKENIFRWLDENKKDGTLNYRRFVNFISIQRTIVDENLDEAKEVLTVRQKKRSGKKAMVKYIDEETLEKQIEVHGDQFFSPNKDMTLFSDNPKSQVFSVFLDEFKELKGLYINIDDAKSVLKKSEYNKFRTDMKDLLLEYFGKLDFNKEFEYFR